MAGKNQAALAVCAQTKVIFPFNEQFKGMTKMFCFCFHKTHCIVLPLGHVVGGSFNIHIWACPDWFIIAGDLV